MLCLKKVINSSHRLVLVVKETYTKNNCAQISKKIIFFSLHQTEIIFHLQQVASQFQKNNWLKNLFCSWMN